MDPLSPQIDLMENEGLQQHNNSIGKGKGITTFYKQNYVWAGYVTKANYQLTKLKSDAMDVINVYRSVGAKHNDFV